MKYDKDIVLPIENIGGNERSIMDGLMGDFVKTMVNLGTAIGGDDKWENGFAIEKRVDKDSPVYVIYKTKDDRDVSVVFRWEIYGGMNHGTIGITVDYKYDKTHMTMSNMNGVNGFSAIAAAFVKIYREHYAEIHK